MSLAQLAPIFAGPDRLPRLYGLGRSLAIYYGQPWRRPGLQRLYRAFIEEGDLAFDIGAHVGNRSLVWAKLGARVVAVEPQPDCAAWLRWQFAGKTKVRIVEAAISSSPGEAQIHVSPTNPTVSTASRDWIEQVSRTDGFADVAWQAPITVEAITLDQLIEAHGVPSFCKIDVEGFEAEVLKGLSQPIKALSLEFLPAAIDVAHEAIRCLASLGDYRFNVSYGEGMAWEMSSWQTLDAMDRWLDVAARGDRSGDVYARLEG